MPRHARRRPFIAFGAAIVLIVAGCGSTDPVKPSPSGSGGPAAPVGTSSPSHAAISSAAPAETPTAADPSPKPSGSGAWSETGSLAEPHAFGGTMTVLRDGRVLVVGGEGNDAGAIATAEIYDPETGQWTETGRMLMARRGLTATLLADGRVLVAGGWDPRHVSEDPPAFGELYDPATGRWTKTASMTRWRVSAHAVRLADGRVVMLGGYISGGGFTRGGEIFDPATATWRSIPVMSGPPAMVAPLRDGRVLVTHGALPAQIFDPRHETWSTTAAPEAAGVDQAVDLANGNVLLIDGQDGTAQTYDVATGIWAPAPGTPTGRGLAATLADGSVVMVGERSSARFDPATGSWTPLPRPPLPREADAEGWDGIHADFLVRLNDGRLLATVGTSAAVFDPAGVAAPVSDLPASGEFVYPGRYATRFWPALTLTVDDVVRIDCQPGFRCRGDVDASFGNWLDLEFGHDHPIDIQVIRLDRFIGANGRPVDPPADLVGWLVTRPNLTVLRRSDVTIGRLPATQLDVRSGDTDVSLGPTGLDEPAGFGFGPRAYRRIDVVNVRGAWVVVMIGSVVPADEADENQFTYAARMLQPIVDSIGWY